MHCCHKAIAHFLVIQDLFHETQLYESNSITCPLNIPGLTTRIKSSPICDVTNTRRSNHLILNTLSCRYSTTTRNDVYYIALLPNLHYSKLHFALDQVPRLKPISGKHLPRMAVGPLHTYREPCPGHPDTAETLLIIDRSQAEKSDS